ncbi:hypothetical protein F5B20DRAFT_545496 [Whalleya microplaca]|nr:hypothetical protein F5B20DRAFT_545496 [Whalleya microplaca]
MRLFCLWQVLLCGTPSATEKHRLPSNLLNSPQVANGVAQVDTQQKPESGEKNEVRPRSRWPRGKRSEFDK